MGGRGEETKAAGCTARAVTRANPHRPPAQHPGTHPPELRHGQDVEAFEAPVQRQRLQRARVAGRVDARGAAVPVPPQLRNVPPRPAAVHHDHLRVCVGGGGGGECSSVCTTTRGGMHAGQAPARQGSRRVCHLPPSPATHERSVSLPMLMPLHASWAHLRAGAHGSVGQGQGLVVRQLGQAFERRGCYVVGVVVQSVAVPHAARELGWRTKHWGAASVGWVGGLARAARVQPEPPTLPPAPQQTAHRCSMSAEMVG